MGRRTSSGRIGAPSFGGLLADAQTITSDDNKDIIFDPTGTGIVKSEGHFQIQNQSSLRFGDADDSNYVAFQAPTTVGSNLTWTLPDSDGSDLQALVTDGNGNLSFQTTGATLDNNAADSATHYPVLSQTTTGTLTTARISSTKFAFQPSTGKLTINGGTTSAPGVLDVNGVVNSLRTENIKTTSHTLTLADRDKVVAMNNTGSESVTVPPDSSVDFPVGSIVYINRLNSGGVTLSEGAGVSLTRTGNLAENEEIYIRKRAANSWIVVDVPRNPSGDGGTVTSAQGFTIHSFTSTGSDTFTIS